MSTQVLPATTPASLDGILQPHILRESPNPESDGWCGAISLDDKLGRELLGGLHSSPSQEGVATRIGQQLEGMPAGDIKAHIESLERARQGCETVLGVMKRAYELKQARNQEVQDRDAKRIEFYKKVKQELMQSIRNGTYDARRVRESVIEGQNSCDKKLYVDAKLLSVTLPPTEKDPDGRIVYVQIALSKLSGEYENRQVFTKYPEELIDPVHPNRVFPDLFSATDFTIQESEELSSKLEEKLPDDFLFQLDDHNRSQFDLRDLYEREVYEAILFLINQAVKVRVASLRKEGNSDLAAGLQYLLDRFHQEYPHMKGDMDLLKLNLGAAKLFSPQPTNRRQSGSRTYVSIDKLAEEILFPGGVQAKSKQGLELEQLIAAYKEFSTLVKGLQTGRAFQPYLDGVIKGLDENESTSNPLFDTLLANQTCMQEQVGS